MCILNYRGRGYSEEFTQNMDALVVKLEPTTGIELIGSADGVCTACVNRTAVTDQNPAGCVFSDKVSRYDAALLARLGLCTGTKISWDKLSKLVRERVFYSRAVFDSICGDCEWHGLCGRCCTEQGV